MKEIFKDKSILVTGGTGSLGKTLVKRILSEEYGLELNIIVLSNHPQYKSKTIKTFQENVEKNCKNNAYNCFFISLTEIKSSPRIHLNEKEYKMVAKKISKFLNN